MLTKSILGLFVVAGIVVGVAYSRNISTVGSTPSSCCSDCSCSPDACASGECDSSCCEEKSCCTEGCNGACCGDKAATESKQGGCAAGSCCSSEA